VSKIEEANIEDENDDDGDFEYSENAIKEAAIIEEIKGLSYGVDFVSLKQKTFQAPSASLQT